MRIRKLNPALRGDLRLYIDRHYIPADEMIVESRLAAELPEPKESAPLHGVSPAPMSGAAPARAVPRSAVKAKAPADTGALSGLDSAVRMLDESFQQMLLRLIDEKGMRDSVCYRRAGVDRKLFSKIRSNPQYRPKKATVIAFIMALELDIDTAREMLMKAGYALSRSSVSDVIVEFFILHGRYRIPELNEALYEYDQPLI